MTPIRVKLLSAVVVIGSILLSAPVHAAAAPAPSSTLKISTVNPQDTPWGSGTTP